MARLEDDPRWYEDALFYELRVSSFYDSDGDGIGDLRGLTDKLDYLEDLGVTTLWLLPICPSPLRDDGYDIADYTDVRPDIGTIRDFKAFLKAAHRRGLRVVTELVLNHTSDQHPWFQRARRAPPGSPHRDFYVWSDTPQRYTDARIIFRDFETSNWSWDSVAQAYYWHRFYSHQPDLNYDNPVVRKAILEVVDFWLGMGVDGLRLDAVPYLFEQEGTMCENLPESHEFLRTLRRHIDIKHKNRMLLAEANQWPEDAAAYFGQGDETHMAFHFPIMPRLFMALHLEDRFPLVDILQQTPAIPDGCQWAIFLRNHDELTLEMVTDEERDYMYRAYAADRRARINLGIRRRLAPLLGNDRRKIELINALLFSLPGTPVLYYGDEIGMGDNIYLGDRDGVRTPMQWSPDRNAGFSRANPQRLLLPINIDPEYHYETVNVEAQQQNRHSLLWWMKRLIAVRKRHRAFGRGSLVMLHPPNPKVLAFVRVYEGETLLVVANMSRFVQHVQLNLSVWRGMIPIELFGGNDFPPIGDSPYFLTLSPRAFFWFELRMARESLVPVSGILLRETWPETLQRGGSEQLRTALATYLGRQRWFRSKARRIRELKVNDAIPIALSKLDAHIVLVEVAYGEGEPEVYAIPLAFTPAGEVAERIQNESPARIVARLADGGVIFEPLGEESFWGEFLALVVKNRRIRDGEGEIVWNRPSGHDREPLEMLKPRVLGTEQTNTSVIFGDQVIFKLFRRVESGVSPDLEITRFLVERAKFEHIARVVGWLDYKPKKGEAATLGILQQFVANQGDAWSHAQDVLGRCYERVLAKNRDTQPELPTDHLLVLSEQEVPSLMAAMMDGYDRVAALCGQRTGEMHLALASSSEDPVFAPEAFSKLYQRSLYQGKRTLTVRVFATLRNQLDRVPAALRARAELVLSVEDKVLSRFQLMLDHKISATRIRHHGDLHLGQLLYTGKDFVFIDFEGEPARPLGERQLKRSPLRDVAGMLRSYHYAAYAALLKHAEAGGRKADVAVLEPWAHAWSTWCGASFMSAYRKVVGTASFAPPKEEFAMLLDAYVLEKAIYELGYELNNRPDWLAIPLDAIVRLVGEPSPSSSEKKP